MSPRRPCVTETGCLKNWFWYHKPDTLTCILFPQGRWGSTTWLCKQKYFPPTDPLESRRAAQPGSPAGCWAERIWPWSVPSRAPCSDSSPSWRTADGPDGCWTAWGRWGRWGGGVSVYLLCWLLRGLIITVGQSQVFYLVSPVVGVDTVGERHLGSWPLQHCDQRNLQPLKISSGRK